ncbi:hypothetical protein AAHC03_019470 [Spirometra sp. Aus1]
MLKDGIDDIYRHNNDRAVNNLAFDVCRPSSNDEFFEWKKTKSEDIHVGDIVFCREDDSFPCDLVVLSSSDPKGTVHITTGNLDGESSTINVVGIRLFQKKRLSVCNYNLPESYRGSQFI